MKSFIPQPSSAERISDYSAVKKHDFFLDLLEEKFLIDDPGLYFSSPQEQQAAFQAFVQQHKPQGTWVWHPWNQQLYHLLDQESYYQLRTVRNRQLLTLEEQRQLGSKTIAVAGLSVGSNILLALARYGIGHTFRIADSDVVAVSNFNRTTYDLTSLNQPKTTRMLEALHSIDPFLKVEVFEEGLMAKTIPDFVSQTDILVDAFDNFPLKLSLREEAKRQRVPVVSGFDIEKGVLLIVERYDLEPDLDSYLFLNHHAPAELLKPASTPEARTQLFIDIIGSEYHSPKMLDSVKNVGKTLTGYPQLIIATLLAASLFTSTIEDILLERTKGSFRRYYSINHTL